ncbi:hypothetical protein HMI55_003706 [Coelomomyces lativittatus]|nr:hypothetical protein HMI55_003706 [Coelomomyces lativittatus]
MGKRTLLLKNSMTDILEVMASTMRESDQKRLHKLVHECCISLASVPESDKSIYSRHFASQIALQKCNFPLGLVFSYLTRIRILSLSEKCPMSNDVKIDPYGYRLISLMHELNAEFLEKAVYMVTNAHRMRIPSLPPLPKDIKESEIPNLPEGDIIETKYSFELKTYPKVIMADTNFISEFQIYCSTRHVALPSYSDQSISIQGENPTFSVSLTTHNRTFQSPTAFCDKKTAKSEVTKLAMVELGLLRLSPKALKVMKYLKKGERVQLLKSPEAVNDLFKANTEKSANELNPVSLLGEFCSKRNLSLPEYTAVSEEYGISAITFRVTVTVNSHSATSDSHASKRLAKRDCSEKLLKILDPIYPETSTSENSTISSSVTPMDVETSTFSKQLNSNNSFDEISNYTTALYELCQGKSMDLPSYTFEDIAGVPLQFKASCSIPALKLEIKNPNAYSSKKTAKHEVSKLVFIECKKLLNSN